MTAELGDADARATIHGNALLIADAGVLLRGDAGSGKSALTLDLIAYASQRGVFARLIGDDRVELVARHGRLIARPHKAIAGLIETRGVGVVPATHEEAGVLRLVVDLLAAAPTRDERIPAEGALQTQICGVTLPRLTADASRASAPRRIFSFFMEL